MLPRVGKSTLVGSGTTYRTRCQNHPVEGDVEIGCGRVMMMRSGRIELPRFQYSKAKVDDGAVIVDAN